MFTSPKSIGFVRSLAFLLYDSGSTRLSGYFISVILILSLLNLFVIRFYFITDFLLWLLVINIHNRIYPALTGGDNLVNQFLLFNCFLSASFLIKTSWRSDLKICFHNVAIVAVIIQVCLVYFLSALAKLGDTDWATGKAIGEISQIRHFSVFSFLNYSKTLGPVLIFLNYVVLFYQLLFPVLIWIKKLKKPLLILGILMHLYIAFVMGLVSFGFIMILAYVFFWPTKQTVS